MPTTGGNPCQSISFFSIPCLKRKVDKPLHDIELIPARYGRTLQDIIVFIERK